MMDRSEDDDLIARLRVAAEDSPSDESDALLSEAADRLAALTTPQEPKWEHGVIGGEDLLRRLMDALAYYHCRSVNPKADSPHLGYHAMSEDQREFLRERQREAAEEVLRMWQAETHAAAPEPEWEYMVRATHVTNVRVHDSQWMDEETARAIIGWRDAGITRVLFKRRKAGLPLPVGDDD